MREAKKSLDAYLVRSALVGDRKAFERLAMLWQPRLEAHAMRLLRDRAKAQDAAQDAWVEIIRGLASVRDRRAFGPWAYRIVTRRCARTIKQLQRDRDLKHKASLEGLVRSEVGMAGEGGDERARLRTAMQSLPAGQYAALALHYFDDLTVAEIAVALEVPEGTVKTRLMHGRQKIAAALGGGSND